MTNQHADYDEQTHGGAGLPVLLFYLPAYISMVTGNYAPKTIPCARKDLHNHTHTKTLTLRLISENLLELEKYDERAPLSPNILCAHYKDRAMSRPHALNIHYMSKRIVFVRSLDTINRVTTWLSTKNLLALL